MSRVLKIEQETGFLYEDDTKVGETILKEGLLYARLFDKNNCLSKYDQVILIPNMEEIKIEWVRYLADLRHKPELTIKEKV